MEDDKILTLFWEPQGCRAACENLRGNKNADVGCWEMLNKSHYSTVRSKLNVTIYKYQQHNIRLFSARDKTGLERLMLFVMLVFYPSTIPAKSESGCVLQPEFLHALIYKTEIRILDTAYNPWRVHDDVEVNGLFITSSYCESCLPLCTQHIRTSS